MTIEISALPEMAVGTCLRSRTGTKTIPVFLPADEEASWSLPLTSPYYQTAHSNQKTPIPISSR